ncbi:hypothetical protein [Acidovorax sp. JHL-3]|nr:hypothetical protein [Acidovorax sp. JHL-3]
MLSRTGLLPHGPGIANGDRGIMNADGWARAHQQVAATRTVPLD